MPLSVEYDTLCLMLFADRHFVSSTGDLLEGHLLEQERISRLRVLRDCPQMMWIRRNSVTGLT